MRRRPSIRLLLLALVGLAIAAALVVVNPLSSLLDDEADDAVAERERSTIATTTLTATVEAEGELVAADSRPVLAARAGTITGLAPVGTPIGATSTLYELDGEPTVALIGPIPAWRTLTSGDEGADVEQLETNLVDLGYDPDGLLTVDETFTEYTAEVVARWQADVGQAETGSVALGSIVFLPEAGTVTSVGAVVGDAVAGSGSTPILTVSTLTRELVATIDPSDLTTIGVGTELSVRLPDRSSRTAVVRQVGSLGDGTWQARADLTEGAGASDDGDEGDGNDGAGELPAGEVVPVTVSWTETIAAEVTTVRANALTRLDTGAYVIEVVEDLDRADADGGDEIGPTTRLTRFVEVGIGERSGSTVEIITDLPAGTTIIAP